MDCLVCEGADASLMTVRFANGDVSHLYLCERCVERFQLDAHVRTVEPPATI